MFAEERYLRIVEVVNRIGKATVSELSSALEVSTVTVRRDLEKLEEKGLLLRTHGGAISLPSPSGEAGLEKSFAEKEEALVFEKELIAEAAAKLVKDDEAILLTPGTTNMFLARKLAGTKKLTLVTNAANIALAVGEQTNLDIVLLGGKLRAKSLATVGSLAEDALRSLRVNKLFLGVDGFDFKEGLTTPNLAEASINRQMISIAKEVIVVADHSKFGRILFSHIASVDEVHTVITDRQLSEEYCNQIRDRGIRLILV
jgi:DeoR family fructose operon transcriptional repressor